MESIEKLEKLTTKRLLNYYRSERDRFRMQPFKTGYESCSADEMKEWAEHITVVKEMLNHREHVEKRKRKNESICIQ
jgi:hypothetical protein